MKTNKLFILFLLAVNIMFSQENNTQEAKNIDNSKYKLNRWSLNIGTGISNGTRPYTKDYFTSTNNKLFNEFKLNSFTVGGQYLFSKYLGIKANLSFDHFINNTKNKSKPFEMAQYRVTAVGVLNLSALAMPKKESTKFNLYFQTGIQFGALDPIYSDYNPKVSKGDEYGSIVLGLTPTYKFSKKAAVFLDITSHNNYGQNLTWNGKHSDGNENIVGNMYSFVLGVSYDLAKN